MDFAQSSTGTPYFLSPEICMGCKYNSKSDIWMLGCTIYELMTLKKPFLSNTLIQLMKQIVSKEVDFSIIDLNYYSEAIFNVCKALMNKDPDKRPIASEIMDIYSNSISVSSKTQIIKKNEYLNSLKTSDIIADIHENNDKPRNEERKKSNTRIIQSLSKDRSTDGCSSKNNCSINDIIKRYSSNLSREENEKKNDLLVHRHHSSINIIKINSDLRVDTSISKTKTNMAFTQKGSFMINQESNSIDKTDKNNSKLDNTSFTQSVSQNLENKFSKVKKIKKYSKCDLINNLSKECPNTPKDNSAEELRIEKHDSKDEDFMCNKENIVDKLKKFSQNKRKGSNSMNINSYSESVIHNPNYQIKSFSNYHQPQNTEPKFTKDDIKPTKYRIIDKKKNKKLFINDAFFQEASPQMSNINMNNSNLNYLNFSTHHNFNDDQGGKNLRSNLSSASFIQNDVDNRLLSIISPINLMNNSKIKKSDSKLAKSKSNTGFKALEEINKKGTEVKKDKNMMFKCLPKLPKHPQTTKQNLIKLNNKNKINFSTKEITKNEEMVIHSNKEINHEKDYLVDNTQFNPHHRNKYSTNFNQDESNYFKSDTYLRAKSKEINHSSCMYYNIDEAIQYERPIKQKNCELYTPTNIISSNNNSSYNMLKSTPSDRKTPENAGSDQSNTGLSMYKPKCFKKGTMNSFNFNPLNQSKTLEIDYSIEDMDGNSQVEITKYGNVKLFRKKLDLFSRKASQKVEVKQTKTVNRYSYIGDGE